MPRFLKGLRFRVYGLRRLRPGIDIELISVSGEMYLALAEKALTVNRKT